MRESTRKYFCSRILLVIAFWMNPLLLCSSKRQMGGVALWIDLSTSECTASGAAANSALAFSIIAMVCMAALFCSRSADNLALSFSSSDLHAAVRYTAGCTLRTSSKKAESVFNLSDASKKARLFVLTASKTMSLSSLN